MVARRFKTVAVLVDTDDTWGRLVVRAIAEHARTSRWSLLICPRDREHRLRLPRGWHGDGVLASLRDGSMVRHLKSAGVPAVDLSIQYPQERWLGRVSTDDRARGRMAFAHFRSKRMVHFACFAPAIGRYPGARADSFREAAEAAGFVCSMFRAATSERGGWVGEYEQVSGWLRSLPRPLAVFASDPHPARQLIDVCQRDGLRVPDDVAVLAGDTDDLLCEIASPQISSVELDCAGVGTRACGILERLMRGGTVPKRPVLIPPVRVRSRQSTDVFAIDDRELLDILAFIRERTTRGLQVASILREFAISRRALELRFAAVLGRTPAEEIRRARVEHASGLLRETELSIAEVALRSGYSGAAYLTHAFKREVGVTPGAFRGTRGRGG